MNKMLSLLCRLWTEFRAFWHRFMAEEPPEFFTQEEEEAWEEFDKRQW